jgi:hypothetical protein
MEHILPTQDGGYWLWAGAEKVCNIRVRPGPLLSLAGECVPGWYPNRLHIPIRPFPGPVAAVRLLDVCVLARSPSTPIFGQVKAAPLIERCRVSPTSNSRGNTSSITDFNANLQVIMSSWEQAFSLSKKEIENAKPPGTVDIVCE